LQTGSSAARPCTRSGGEGERQRALQTAKQLPTAQRKESTVATAKETTVRQTGGVTGREETYRKKASRGECGGVCPLRVSPDVD